MEKVFNALFNVLFIYIAFRFIRLFISKRKVSTFLQAVVYFMVWLIDCIVFFVFDNRYLTTGSIFVLLMIATILLYEASIIKKFMAIISALALGILFEEIIWQIFVWFGISNPNNAVGSLLSSFLYIIFILVVERFIFEKNIDYISKSSYFNFIMILTGSIILVEVLANVEEDYEWVLMGLSAVCLINVSTFYLYDKVNEVYRETLYSEVMEERIIMHERQSSLMKQSQENIRSLWHDMKNHLVLLDTYLAGKNTIKPLSILKISRIICMFRDSMYAAEIRKLMRF